MAVVNGAAPAGLGVRAEVNVFSGASSVSVAVVAKVGFGSGAPAGVDILAESLSGKLWQLT